MDERTKCDACAGGGGVHHVSGGGVLYALLCGNCFSRWSNGDLVLPDIPLVAHKEERDETCE